MIEIAQDLAAWIKKYASERVNTRSAKQQQKAEARASSAEQRAEQASNETERVRAEAEATAWREIAEQLRQDNEALKNELDEVIQQSQVYARKRIDSEAERDKVQERVFSLQPPTDAIKPKQ